MRFCFWRLFFAALPRPFSLAGLLGTVFGRRSEFSQSDSSATYSVLFWFCGLCSIVAGSTCSLAHACGVPKITFFRRGMVMLRRPQFSSDFSYAPQGCENAAVSKKKKRFCHNQCSVFFLCFSTWPLRGLTKVPKLSAHLSLSQNSLC